MDYAESSSDLIEGGVSSEGIDKYVKVLMLQFCNEVVSMYDNRKHLTQANTKLIKAFRTRGFCRVRIVCTL